MNFKKVWCFLPTIGWWFLKLSWRVCCNKDFCPTPSKVFSDSVRLFIFNKFPAHTTAPGPALETHCSRECALFSFFVPFYILQKSAFYIFWRLNHVLVCNPSARFHKWLVSHASMISTSVCVVMVEKQSTRMMCSVVNFGSFGTL